jgi:N-acetylglucosamine kinase-like BadF-type ATPase
MILIADSGSTKTEWRLVDKNKIEKYSGIGLNPYFVDEKIVYNEVAEIFKKTDIRAISQVYFYGAGCRIAEKKNIIKNGLQQLFTNSQIEIESDMLLAAHALFGNKKGIPVILGTGMNCGIYNGIEITDTVGSFGYMLGDEGSGAYFGIKLLKAYLNKELPNEIILNFEKEFNVNKEIILDSIYKKPLPNKFAASFAPFYNKYKHLPQIEIMLTQGFNEFFEKQILKLPDYKKYHISFVGSVAFHFKEILTQSAKKYHLKIEKIVQSPVDDVIQFHLH